MRSLPKPSSKASTDTQLLYRARMALAAAFSHNFSPLVTLGYKNDSKEQTGYNTVTAHLLENAVTGVYPNMEIDYSKVLISKAHSTFHWMCR